MDKLFDRYEAKADKVFLESLDAEVLMRNLTLKEQETFGDKVVKGFDKEGEPILDMKAITLSRLEKVCLHMVEPKISLKELQGLSSDVKEFIAEVLDYYKTDEEAEIEGELKGK